MHPRRSESLRSWNTLSLPGTAAAAVSVSGDRDLLDALDWARKQSLPVIPLGEGSNIVLAGDLRALALRQDSRGIEELERDGDRIRLRVAAGENWHQLVCWTLDRGFFGLENLALIPGRVGAAPIQNIGAYGVELESSLLSVHALRIEDGDSVELDRASCEFGYRDSVFKHALCDTLVITAVELELALQPAVNADYPVLARQLRQSGCESPGPRDVFDAVVQIRSSKLPDPAVEPNAGSFFKNPLVEAALAEELHARFPGLPVYPQADGRCKLPAAWLIEQCGWKGRRQGAVGVHTEHALVLVNYGGGRGEELLALAGDITDSVQEAFGLRLAIEPRVYGVDG